MREAISMDDLIIHLGNYEMDDSDRHEDLAWYSRYLDDSDTLYGVVLEVRLDTVDTVENVLTRDLVSMSWQNLLDMKDKIREIVFSFDKCEELYNELTAGVTYIRPSTNPLWLKQTQETLKLYLSMIDEI